MLKKSLLIYCLLLVNSLQCNNTDVKDDELTKPQSQYGEHHLYAPWRDTYSNDTQKNYSTVKKADECPFCVQIKEKKDPENYFLARYNHFVIILNRFPYEKGHILIIPYKHVKHLSDLSFDELTELIQLQKLSVDLLRNVMQCDGVNVGINIDKAAGSSIPDHLHVHILPRWVLPKNFIHLIGRTEVACYSLEKLHKRLAPEFEKLKDALEKTDSLL